jgi:hypothetical protein
VVENQQVQASLGPGAVLALEVGAVKVFQGRPADAVGRLLGRRWRSEGKSQKDSQPEGDR